MAGRPKTMHKRVAAITAGVQANCDRLFGLVPKQYHKSPDDDDPTCTGWRDAMTGMARGWESLNELKKLSAAKAGIVEDGELIEIDGDMQTLDEWSVLYQNPKQVILDRVAKGDNWENALTRPATADELLQLQASADEGDQ